MSARRASVLALAVIVVARPTAQESRLVPPEAQLSLDRQISTFVPEALRTYEVAGAIVAVSSAGAHWSASFGVLDAERTSTIPPEQARVHVASVTKLVTAMAVLQQVEAGRLSLDADVGDVLGGADPVGAVFAGHGVRVRHLLTHSAGIADRWLGLASWNADEVRSLSDYLANTRPSFVRAPGSSSMYSNYGFAALGYVAARVAGMPYDALIRRAILEPALANDSYVGPRAADNRDIVGFHYRKQVTVEPRVFEHGVPAGGLHATMPDLVRVLSVLVNDGVSGERRLLSAPSVSEILSRQFPPGGVLPGWGMGAYEWPQPAGTTAWIAGGEVPGLSTRVLIVPTAHLVVAVAVNRKDPTLALKLFSTIVPTLGGAARAAPRTSSRHQGAAAVPDPRDGISGSFRLTIDDPGSFMHFGALFAPTLTVVAAAEGSVVAAFGNSSRAVATWKRTDVGTWADTNGQPVANVTRDSRGALLVHVADPTAGVLTFAAAPWWQREELAMFGIVLSIVTAFASLGAGAWRRHLTLPQVLMAGGILLSVVALGAAINQLVVRYDDRFAFPIPWWFVVALYLPLLVVLGVVLEVHARLSTSNSRPTSYGGISLMVAASSYFLVLWIWNLLPWYL